MMTPSERSFVNVAVDLPKELVADVEDLCRRDPEFLGKAIRYVLARRTIFEVLHSSAPGRR